MPVPDYERAKTYIVSRLEHELAPDLTYHSLRHTLYDVLPAATQLGEMEGISADDMLLLKTAALYHDIGYIEQYMCNEEIAVRISAETLPDFNYGAVQIERIGQIIMATQLPQQPQDLLQSLICDADLGVLGREDFYISSFTLRLELERYGQPTTLREWFERQLAFVEAHCYFTSSAQVLHDAQKQLNIQEIRALLNQ
jgi:uncharacterized protein